MVFEGFKQREFCGKLAERVRERMEDVRGNWRESGVMETMVTLALRLKGMGGRELAEGLLRRAREITLRWIRVLRKEILAATDADASKAVSYATMWAALTCRLTNTEDEDDDEEKQLTHEAVSTFIEASIALQDNFDGASTLSTKQIVLLKSALIRDQNAITIL